MTKSYKDGYTDGLKAAHDDPSLINIDITQSKIYSVYCSMCYKPLREMQNYTCSISNCSIKSKKN
jgi:hypothetical protein